MLVRWKAASPDSLAVDPLSSIILRHNNHNKQLQRYIPTMVYHTIIVSQMSLGRHKHKREVSERFGHNLKRSELLYVRPDACLHEVRIFAMSNVWNHHIYVPNNVLLIYSYQMPFNLDSIDMNETKSTQGCNLIL